jgi:RNA polymerase sigma factor (sigma-70 family)
MLQARPLFLGVCLQEKIAYLPATSDWILVSHLPMTDDRALVSRIKDGDTEAFRQLITRHQRLVAHMIGRVVRNEEDKEELCQDVFLKVYDKIAEFHFQSRLSTWVATIAYRHAINHVRKKKIQISEPDEDDFRDRFMADDDPSRQLEDKDMEGKVMDYVEKLPVHYRTVLTLYHVDGMSYPEIANITQMPEGTVKNYLFRARNLLKEKILKYFGPDDLI